MFRFEIAAWRYRAPIETAARRYGVPDRLIAALIWQETRFQPNSRGRAGELGLMQVRPATAREWAKAERVADFASTALFDPATNILAGTWYLARALDRWSTRDDPLPYALAEYNAGRSRVIHWLDAASRDRPFADAIGYPSTRRYVNAIARRYRTFGKPWERWGEE